MLFFSGHLKTNCSNRPRSTTLQNRTIRHYRCYPGLILLASLKPISQSKHWESILLLGCCCFRGSNRVETWSFFIFNMIDLPNKCGHIISYLSADDTDLLYESNTSSSFPNEELPDIGSWLAENKLLLNCFKTQLVTFNSCNSIVILDGKVLPESNYVNYLSVKKTKIWNLISI